MFENYSQAVLTSRDAWCYNFSETKLSHNMRSMIDFYNQEVSRYELACHGLSKENYPDISDFINNDSFRISWSRAIKNDLGRFTKRSYTKESITSVVYRPFAKTWMYFNRHFNSQMAAHNASPYTFTKPTPHPPKLTHKAASLTNQAHPQQQATHAAMPSPMQA
jgi:predicted helicase